MGNFERGEVYDLSGFHIPFTAACGHGGRMATETMGVGVVTEPKTWRYPKVMDLGRDSSGMIHGFGIALLVIVISGSKVLGGKGDIFHYLLLYVAAPWCVVSGLQSWALARLKRAGWRYVVSLAPEADVEDTNNLLLELKGHAHDVMTGMVPQTVAAGEVVFCRDQVALVGKQKELLKVTRALQNRLAELVVAEAKRVASPWLRRDRVTHGQLQEAILENTEIAQLLKALRMWTAMRDYPAIG